MRITTRTREATESIWITPGEAALYLGVGIDTIYDACAAGGLRHVKLGHRTIRLKRDWVDAWVERRAQVHD